MTALADDSLVPEGKSVPSAASKEWLDLLAEHYARGSSAAHLRSYLKVIGKETWQYVNWLTHARNAGSLDAEIGVAGVSHLLSTFTAAWMRWSRGGRQRCAECGSYRVVGGCCQRCGWIDDTYEAPAPAELSDEVLAQRLKMPCTPSSDISTYITPEDYRRR